MGVAPATWQGMAGWQEACDLRHRVRSVADATIAVAGATATASALPLACSLLPHRPFPEGIGEPIIEA